MRKLLFGLFLMLASVASAGPITFQLSYWPTGLGGGPILDGYEMYRQGLGNNYPATYLHNYAWANLTANASMPDAGHLTFSVTDGTHTFTTTVPIGSYPGQPIVLESASDPAWTIPGWFMEIDQDDMGTSPMAAFTNRRPTLAELLK